MKLLWQSKLVLLLVLPFAAASVVLQAHWWAESVPPVAIWAIGLSLLLGLIAWKAQTATPAAAFVGAVLAASLMFSTATFPYRPWRTALIPVLVLLVLTSLATRLDRAEKLRLGIAERRTGRIASQVAANLGVAALASSEFTQSWLIDSGWVRTAVQQPALLFTVGLAALTEAAADTISSEVGQVLGGQPRMITTLRTAEPGTDGAISFFGSLAGIGAAGLVAAAGTLALAGGSRIFAISWASGVFGLFFDSLLGATLERRGWLNNDAVNFLSTVSAAALALLLLVLLPHPVLG
jgi:uncharacterized protein (TIGR00297 family)